MLRGLLKGLRSVPRSQPCRGIFGLRGVLSGVKAQFDHGIAAGPANHSPHTMEMSETELMDEDAHEVQAWVGENPFDLDIMGGDVQAQRNFGTIDNPVLMFSANVGWRYVMCSGPNDEDEGSSHQGVWFLLREGPIHRCPSCGQCFKLLNLKDEISEENDYYSEHYTPIPDLEMGDDDDWVQRWTMHNFAEPYPSIYPFQNTNSGYILANADDHDRILTDPAYRLQKLADGHEKMSEVSRAYMDIEMKLLWQNGGRYPTYQITPEDYNDLITSERAIRKLDRIYAKIESFNKREVLDPENHARRQKRMETGILLRQNDLTNNEDEFKKQYKDYYQTDYASDEEFQEEMDDVDLAVSGIYNFKNYQFVQEGTSAPIHAVQSTFEKKAFRFRHRMFTGHAGEYLIRETRMKKRFFDRLEANDPKKLIDAAKVAHLAHTGDLRGALAAAQPYREYVMSEAVQQYKDYFESDVEDLADFEGMTANERAEFAKIFTDFSNPYRKRAYRMFENYGEEIESKSAGGLFSQWSHYKKELMPRADAEGLKFALTELHLPTSIEENLLQEFLKDTLDMTAEEVKRLTFEEKKEKALSLIGERKAEFEKYFGKSDKKLEGPLDEKFVDTDLSKLLTDELKVHFEKIGRPEAQDSSAVDAEVDTQTGEVKFSSK